MMDLIEIVTTVLAVFIGYALGVSHTKRAMYDAIDQIRRERKGSEDR